ncbi:MAG: DUF4168 domain-containing protein [Rhizobiaceae bacterium]
MSFTRNVLSSVLAFGLLASPAAIVSASAQTQSETMPAPEAAPVDEGKLRSFAVAYLQVRRVAQTYQPQIEQAADQDEQQRLRQEATTGMVEAVESADGITVEEYNSIFATAQSDPALSQQINAFVSEAAEEGGQ